METTRLDLGMYFGYSREYRNQSAEVAGFGLGIYIRSFEFAAREGGLCKGLHLGYGVG